MAKEKIPPHKVVMTGGTGRKLHPPPFIHTNRCSVPLLLPRFR